MRRVLALPLPLLLAACVTTPRSREGLKAASVKSPRMMIADSYMARRSLDAVAAALERKWRECCEVSVTTTHANKAGMTTSRHRDTLHPKFRRVGNARVEMTLRMTTPGMIALNKVPAGGEYMVALDLERIAPNQTKLSWHSPRIGWKDSGERNKQWADGKDAPCP